MPHDPHNARAVLDYRKRSLDQRHSFHAALLLSLPGLLCWLLLLMVGIAAPLGIDLHQRLGAFPGAMISGLWLLTILSAIFSLIYYYGITRRRPRPWFVETCLALNIFNLVVSGILLIPLLIIMYVHY